MPEAFAVVFVFVVTVAAWVGAWMQTRNQPHDRAPEEIARLQEHASWLQQRLAVARQENWDEAMVAALRNELRTATRRLARANSRTV
ncbi:MAG: hypothetical protein ABIZ49_03835 [Opitutaceae bacterium]